MNLFKQFSAVKKFINKEQYREAQEILQQILHQFPQNKQAQQVLEIVNSNLDLIHSDTLINGQSTDLAVPYLEDINLLTELYHSKQFDVALVKVQHLIEHHSTDANLFYIQGTCFNGLKKFNDAISSFEKAIALNPEFDLAWMKIGLVYIDKEDYSTAQKFLLKAYSFEKRSLKLFKII